MAAQQNKLRRSWLTRLGPGLITGAADDDPSGIATYSQAGAQFGVNMLWTVVLTFPLMAAIQLICARIGRVTGSGLATNMLQVLPKPLVILLVALLLIANAVNIGADLSAMGAAARLVLGGNEALYAIGFGLLSLLLQVFVPYHRYVHFLKWMTLALFAYVAALFSVTIDWKLVAAAVIWPTLPMTAATFTTIVAVFGTTISPYLFFWQSAEEVEDAALQTGSGRLLDHPEEARPEFARMALDTCIGMGFSNAIAFCIILTTAATLHQSGVQDITSAAQAAEALRPIAGDFAFFLFSLGIIGTGLLALPVLAGSAAYAIGELAGWRVGLEYQPLEARGFYGVIALAFALGLLMLFVPLDPIRALYWSAVLNGAIAVPLMAATMIVATSRTHLGPYVATPAQRFFGWAGTGVMALAALAMFIL